MTHTQRVMACAVSAPVVLVMLAFGVSGAVDCWRGQPLFWPARDVTLSEAVLMEDQSEAVRLIMLGSDPNRRYEVRAIPAPRPELTPLEAAILSRQPYMVQIVVERGALVTSDNSDAIACLAKSVGVPAIQQYLAAHGVRSDDCKTGPGDGVGGGR